MPANLYAYMKLLAYEKNISIKSLAVSSKKDQSYISRILNNQIKYPDSKMMLILFSELGINQTRIQTENKDFQSLYSVFLNTVYYIEREKRSNLINEIKSYEEKIQGTPDMILFYLAQMIEKTVSKQYDSEFLSITKKLYHIHNALDNKEKKVFLVFYIGALVGQNKFDDFDKLTNKCQKILYDDEHLDMMLSYYIFLYGTQKQMIKPCFAYYDHCLKICIQTNNKNRQFNLEIAYANYLLQLGFTNESLKINMKLLDSSKKNHPYNYEILLNNIAWTYMLLHQYEQAIEYYLKVIEISPNNDRLFNIAWCYYQTHDNDHALKYIQIGKKSKKAQDYYYLYLEWLEAMIYKKYSKRSYDILIKLSSSYKNMLPDDMRNFVSIELINYHKAHHQYKEAMAISEKLVSAHCLSATMMI